MSWVSRISLNLGIDALLLGIYDTAGGAEYWHFRDGEEVESLCLGDEEDRFESRLRSPKTGTWSYDDIDLKFAELGIVPPMFWTPFEKIGVPLLALTEIDSGADQIAEALVLEKKGKSVADPWKSVAGS